MNQRAYSYLIKLLSARDYSEHKLREKMREKKYPAEDIESAITEIKARGYLREDQYAEARIKAFMNKGYSPDYIEQKLAQEHLKTSQETINALFLEYRLSPEDQIERLITKKIGSRTDLDFEAQSKVLRYVLSKGHDFGLSKRILKKVLSQAPTDAL